MTLKTGPLGAHGKDGSGLEEWAGSLMGEKDVLDKALEGVERCGGKKHVTRRQEAWVVSSSSSVLNSEDPLPLSGP